MFGTSDILAANSSSPSHPTTRPGASTASSDLISLTEEFRVKENQASDDELIEIVGQIFTQLEDYNAFLRYRKAVVKKYGNADIITRMLNLSEMKIRPFCWQIVEDIHESYYKVLQGEINSLPIDVQREFSEVRRYRFSPNEKMPVLFLSFRRGLGMRIDWVDPQNMYMETQWVDDRPQDVFNEFNLENLMYGMARTAKQHLIYGREVAFDDFFSLDMHNRQLAAKAEDGYGVFMLPIIMDDPSPYIAGVADLIMRIPLTRKPDFNEGGKEYADLRKILGRIYYLFPPFMQSEIRNRYNLHSEQIQPLTSLPNGLPTEEDLMGQFQRALDKNKRILKKPTMPEYPLRPLTGVMARHVDTDQYVRDFDKVGVLEKELAALPANSIDFGVMLDHALKIFDGDVLQSLAACRHIIRRSPRNFREANLVGVGGESALAIANDLEKRGIENEFTQKTSIENNLKDIPSVPSRIKRVTYDHALAFIIVGYYVQSFIENGDKTTAQEDLVNVLNDQITTNCQQARSSYPGECIEKGRSKWVEDAGLATYRDSGYLYNDQFSFSIELIGKALKGELPILEQASSNELLGIYKLFNKSAPLRFAGVMAAQKTTGKWFIPEYEMASWKALLALELNAHGENVPIEQYVVEARACNLGQRIFFSVDSLIGSPH